MLNPVAMVDRRSTVLTSVLPQALEEIGGPRSLTVYLILKYAAWDELASLKFDPKHYNSSEEAHKAFLATELVRKADFLPASTLESRKENAMSAFYAAEELCEQTNLRMRAMSMGFGVKTDFERILLFAQRKIALVLGRMPVERLGTTARWSGGSDGSARRPYVTAYHKFRAIPTCTDSARVYFPALFTEGSLWARWLVATERVDGPVSPLTHKVHNWNKYTTVPKDAFKDRSICVEPSINIHLQLQVGAMLRRRLLHRAGIDLDSQDKNRELAMTGSLSGLIATIDLSSASDTLSRGLVDYLFTPLSEECSNLRQWRKVLFDLRCAFTSMPGAKRLLNAKFSSMGNGFTFELETLIFWALAQATCEFYGIGQVQAVYGDDIIVDVSAFDRVRETLTSAGFLLNQRKSFADSYFRESCGMNAWNGRQMQVYRVTKCDTISDLYAIHNGLRKVGCGKAANLVLRLVPRDARYYGPEVAGDCVLMNPDFQSWKGRLVGRDRGWFFQFYRLKVLKFIPDTVPSQGYEPAILHSFSSLGPIRDKDNKTPWLVSWYLQNSREFGARGRLTLTRGRWGYGTMLVPVGS